MIQRKKKNIRGKNWGNSDFITQAHIYSLRKKKRTQRKSIRLQAVSLSNTKMMYIAKQGEQILELQTQRREVHLLFFSFAS